MPKAKKKRIVTGENITMYLPKKTDKRVLDWLNTQDYPSREILKILQLYITGEFFSKKEMDRILANMKVLQVKETSTVLSKQEIEPSEQGTQEQKIAPQKEVKATPPKKEVLDLNKGYFGKFADTDLASISKTNKSKSFIKGNLKN